MKNLFKNIYQTAEPQFNLIRLLHETLDSYNKEDFDTEGSGLISVYMVRDSEIESIEKIDFDCRYIRDTNDRSIESLLDEVTVACTMYVTKEGLRHLFFLTYTNNMYETHCYLISSTDDRWARVYDYFKNKIRNKNFRDVDKMCLSVMIGHF